MQLSSLSHLSAAPQRLQSSSAPAEQPQGPADSVTLGNHDEPPVYRFTSRNCTVDGSPYTLELRLPEDRSKLNAYFDADAQQIVFKTDPAVIGHEYGHSILPDPWYSDYSQSGALPERSWGDVDLNRFYRDEK